jgi:hypothetical protein
MTNSDSKVPTWQWVAGIAITILMIVAGASLSETRNDVRAHQKDIAALYVVQAKSDEKFNNIIEGIAELKVGQKAVVQALDAHEKATASQLRVKSWNDPEKRTLKGRE